MKPNISIAVIIYTLSLTCITHSIGQAAIQEPKQHQSYILNSIYKPGSTYLSQVDVELATNIEMGTNPVLSDKRSRTMAISLTTENGSNGDVPFKLTFTDFHENSTGELSEPEFDIKMDTRIAGASGDIEGGHLAVKNVCGVEPIYLDDMQNVLKPVFELAYLHFPKKAMKKGDSFQNRFSVDYPLGAMGLVKTKQDMVVTLLSVENNIANLGIETIVSGTFVHEGVSYPVTGGGKSLMTLDIENQFFISFEKNHTDVISFKSNGTDITVRSTEISRNRTSIN